MLKFFSEELLMTSRYEPYQVVVAGTTETGTHEFILYCDGIYRAELVGGGGGCANNFGGIQLYQFAGGGSAASFVGNIKLYAGSYKAVVGAGAANANGNIYTTTTAGNGGDTVLKKGSTAIITAGGGKGGSVDGYSGKTAGAGGTLNRHGNTTYNENASKTDNGTAGNTGNSNIEAVASKCPPQGRGAGYPVSSGRGSTGGYFKLSFIRSL